MEAQTEKKQSMRTVLKDIIVDVSWAHISKKYFGKSRSWLSQKMIGKSGNGADTEFSDKERKTLKGALYDLSDRIRTCADGL